MKNQIKKLAVAALLVASCTYVYAQVPPPSRPPSPAGNPGLLPPPPPGNAPMPAAGAPPFQQQPLQNLNTITGKVAGFVTNERYMYNGITLQGSSGTINVRFSEHLAKQLMDVVKKGGVITVRGFSATGPDGVVAFQLVNATAGGIQINDTPPVPPAQPAVPEPQNYTGSISNFRHDLQGMINGLNLDNKVIIDLPPPATAQLQSLLKTGDKVEVSGFKDTPPSGVVLAANAPVVIHPQTITLNGQTYLLR